MKTIFTLFALALTLTVAKAQTALNFPDADDYVNIPHDDLFNFDGINFTMEAWVKCTGGGYQTVAATDDVDGVGHRGFWFGVTPSGYGGIQIFNNTFSFSTVQGTTIVNDGEWHHIAAGSNGTTIFVITDGVAEGTGAHYDMVSSSDHALQLGIDREGNDFNGSMDEVRFWWGAKTAAQIDFAMDSCMTGTDAELLDSLIAVYAFEDGSGTAVSEPAYGLNGTTMNMTDDDWVEGIVCVADVGPSGIQESEELEGVTVFYNDVQNQVNVNLVDLENANIKLYDMSGAIIHQANNINESIYTFDLNTQAGMYIAVVESNGKTGHFKIMKTK
ncbi:MAG: T9SS type A sorting domain-containing protein [Crocinitomix sp.]|nr:T9SS type A sorting domain-containing protein [Crocinitomix sp.]